MKSKLDKYQREGVKWISKKNGRCIIGDEMGIGKTFQSLAWAKQNVYDKGKLTLVICDANLKINWKREAREHCGMKSYIAESTTPPKIPPKSKLMIINYDIVRYWKKIIRKMKPDLIIIDECQALASPTTLRSKSVKDVCYNVPHIIAMSGTPIQNSPIEFWTILNILFPKKYKSRHGFGLKFTYARRTPWGWQYKGVRNAELLHKRLKRIMLRRLSDKVLDLPPLIRKVVPIGIKRRSEYEKLMLDFAKWLAESMKRGVVTKRRFKSALRAEALARMNYAKQFVAENKLDKVIVWINRKLKKHPDAKMIVFGTHKHILKKLRDAFPHCSDLINGSVSMVKRDQIIQRFRHDSRLRIIFANRRAAGNGWNGTAATIVAKVELGWTPGEHAQCEKRAHRRGQTKPVRSYYLIAKNTIEEQLCQLIQEKQKVISQVLDGVENREAGIHIFDQMLSWAQMIARTRNPEGKRT